MRELVIQKILEYMEYQFKDRSELDDKTDEELLGLYVMAVS